jgi:trehalose/maltose hydrolase-like predicted phosphorylase
LNRRKIDLIPEPAWSDPPKSQMGELVTTVDGRLRDVGLKGLPEVVAQATEAATMAGLADARITSDAKYVEIGLTDKADSARWMLSELWRRGIGPGLALIVGDEMGPLGGIRGSDSFMLIPEAERCTAVSVGVEPGDVPDGVTHIGGGPDAFLSLLDDQLRRRMLLEMPEPNREPGWDFTIDGLDPAKERMHEALLTLSDGLIGTSGIPLGDHPSTTPEVVASGLYDGEGSEEHLLLCPVWNRLPLEVADDGAVRRHLDLRTGLLHQEIGSPSGRVRAVQFSSLPEPGHVVLRADAPPDVTLSGRPLLAPPGRESETADNDGATWMRLRASRGGVVAAAREREHRDDEGLRSRLERFGVYQIDPTGVPAAELALRAASTAATDGFEVMLAAHRAAWASRWEDADIVVEGDEELQFAVRFALFHLMGSVADGGEAAVGARGLSGPAYRGHVFWDSDVFVLPFLAATHPDSARAMLEYRLRRLPAARTRAAVEGHEGVRLPWESARAGTDVTPLLAHDLAGRMRDIRTGLEEIHIIADVAWAAALYLDWSGDDDFGKSGGRELLVETARYWASRIVVDDEGRGHIEDVIGPDEYHESVTDNAFTNVMARWNLRRAARAVAAQPDDPARLEVERWLHLAATIVDGYDPVTSRYEQFAGFSRLEPLVVKDLGIRRPVAADILLGVDRVAAAQIVKQADVMMLHHMVPEETVHGSLLPNLAYYEPRTSHGSSLSPGVHASLLARAGRFDEALEELRIAARIDLDDLTGTTATGLHLATMGSVWQAIAFGFVGLRAHATHLSIDPHLPPAWDAMEIRLRFRGTRVRVRVEPGSFTVTSERPLRVSVGGVQLAAGGDPGTRFHLEGDTWEVVTT